MAGDSNDADDNEGVGYAQPPKQTRFKKGRSGNPRGRVRSAASSFKADLAAELQEKLTLTENGRARHVSKQRALIKTLTAAAIKKDIRAVTALLAFMRLFGVGNEAPVVAERVELDDLDLLDTYLKQQRKRQAGAVANDAKKSTRRNGTPKQ